MVERGTKHGLGQGKDRWDLVPYLAFRDVVKVLTLGGVKYGDHNWKRGIPYSENFAAVMRHMTAWWGGENLDPETRISHLAHAMCGVLFLLHYSKNPRVYGVFDDRMQTDPEVRTVAGKVCQDPTHVGVGDHPIV